MCASCKLLDSFQINHLQSTLFLEGGHLDSKFWRQAGLQNCMNIGEDSQPSIVNNGGVYAVLKVKNEAVSSTLKQGCNRWP